MVEGILLSVAAFFVIGAIVYAVAWLITRNKRKSFFIAVTLALTVMLILIFRTYLIEFISDIMRHRSPPDPHMEFPEMFS